MAEITVYSSASHTDGYGYHHIAVGDTWANIIGGVGTSFLPDNANLQHAYIKADEASNKWELCARVISLFDISGIPANQVITAAILSYYGHAKTDDISITPSVNIYQSAPANDDDLVAGDYNSLSATPFCDTPITYANWKTTNPFWNDFTFNAAGLSYLNSTYAGDGVARLGTRDVAYDVGATPPTWDDSGTRYTLMTSYGYSDVSGNKPKLVITYIASGWVGKINGVTNPTKINGIAVADIIKVNGI